MDNFSARACGRCRKRWTSRVLQRGTGLPRLWAAYGAFMLARMVTLVLRVGTGAWIRVGAGAC